MPLINLIPRNTGMEDFLTYNIVEIRRTLKEVVSETWHRPQHDIVVNAFRCPYLGNIDETTADCIISVVTNPNPDLEASADTLREEIANLPIFRELDMVEVSIQFTVHSWCLMEKGEIVDQVDYNKGE
ncbi:hypothetical protein COV24_03065 [candidate division WWE3 bacterium CG10_big_fil_rev_8_21_14_0_10_32_10]|uniref:Uncharacterized protein n=1 Tax=candidate division WWE3 bacterium CG10_big_fil_rev_8_21_14_0_10_32_10 TaxID=1975090 RepID=A0A2H0RA89_UNCKA|nr:MAG: hypothetical protein COV24_03065 [candidate division WWE3 bacterium CG10_big_fil_rev_8_21_14_0_10_32_10]